MKRFSLLLGILFSFLFGLEAKDIVLWHALDGPLEKTFVEIVEEFNQSSDTYKVIPMKKGNYKEIVDLGLEAAKTGGQPHILQVYEVATLSCMQTSGVFKSVDDLMRTYNKRFDPDVYIDVVRSFYSTPDGKMMSLPWNASTGILFYNKDAFAKAGLDPEKPPKTWKELEEMSQKLIAKGYKGFTTAWPAAYHLEHVSCWHNLPFATYENGFKGPQSRFVFNGQGQVFHISKVAEWQKSGVFAYTGRFSNDSENFFTDEKCAILLQGANRLPLLKQKAKFPIGVGYMPYWPQISEKPHNLNIGGASFWVMEGFSDEEYKGIVQFFEFLSSTEIQSYWHQKTGYLPITDAAYYLTKKKGFYQDNPAIEIAVLEVMQNKPTAYSKGMRFGDYMKIREQIIDHLEKAFSGEMTAKEALDSAVENGNILLEQFEKSESAKTKRS